MRREIEKTKTKKEGKDYFTNVSVIFIQSYFAIGLFFSSAFADKQCVALKWNNQKGQKATEKNIHFFYFKDRRRKKT